MIRSAVVLAAGMGLRIRDHHDLPKGLIRLHQKTIIEESLDQLKQYGIENILVVTGYGAECYNAISLGRFDTVKNEIYERSGSLYSLYCARDWIKEDFLLLESDLIYETRAIQALVHAPQQDAILVSGPTNSGDEIYVEAKNGCLLNMSKNKRSLTGKSIIGEFVGISRLSFSAYQRLIEKLDNDSNLLETGHYEEDGLVALAQSQSIFCLKMPDLKWYEIDNLTHLERAKQNYTKVRRNVLLNPGPVTTTESVKQALVVPDICHREKEFTELTRAVRRDLLKVVNAGEDYTSVLFTASGTGAIEACLSSVVPKNKKILVINNGSYGQRLTDIAKRFHIDVVEVQFPYDQPISFDIVESKLAHDDDIHGVAMVHHETSMGLLNPLQPMGEICHRYHCQFIVDAMSSYAGCDIDVYRDYIDFLISSSNKCLHGMPGLSFVICSKTSLIQSKGSARSYYFDLYQQYHSLETSGEMPFTPPVQVMYSLKQALDEYLTETPEGRKSKYRQNYDQLIAGIKQLGFKCITPADRQSGLLVTIQFPEDQIDYNFDELHDYLYERGYTIYPRKLPIPNTFRLACMGDLNKNDIDGFLREMKAYLSQLAKECIENKE